MKPLTSTAAEEAFYGAFARLDLEAMGALWVEGANASCVHPGGPLIQGKQAVIQGWAEIFAGADPPGIAYRVVSRHESGALAVHLVKESIRPHRAASANASLVIATNVYILDGDGWRMLAHHASLPLMPGRGERERTGLH